jgi:aspartate racemase
MADKIVGILGGMGPEATKDFFAKVIALTPAQRDQDHLRIIIDNNPKIPDRTEAILNRDESLFTSLLETARNLERAGVDFIVIPCNTAHYHYDELVKNLSLPVLNVVKETLSAVLATLPDCKKVGLLATSGTVTSGIFVKEFQKKDIEVIVPSSENQAEVMKAILDIKSGRDKGEIKTKLIGIGNLLAQTNGVKALVLGCTDIPPVINQEDFSIPVFDSNMILANATVRFAML